MALYGFQGFILCFYVSLYISEVQKRPGARAGHVAQALVDLVQIASRRHGPKENAQSTSNERCETDSAAPLAAANHRFGGANSLPWSGVPGIMAAVHIMSNLAAHRISWWAGRLSGR
jgi:hypothetical protein